MPERVDQDFWPPMYGWGSRVGQDHRPPNPVLYRRSTHGPVAHWWAGTRTEWRRWWHALYAR